MNMFNLDGIAGTRYLDSSTAMKTVMENIGRAKGKWLDSIMRDLLPAHVIKWSHGGPKERERAALWMQSNNFKIEEHPNETRLMLGDQFISYFKVVTKDGKLVVEAKKAKSLTKPVWN